MEFFSSINYYAIFKIIGISIILGIENVAMIMLACANLPNSMRIRTVLLGTFGAMLFRAILPFVDSYLMSITAVKLVAGAYLLWIAYGLLSKNNKVRSIHHIWGAVKTIIVVDFMMSLSNVLVIVEAAQSAGTHNNAYAFVGLVLSIQAVAFADKGIMKLKDKFPIFIWASVGLLGWVGVEMIFSDPLLSNYLERARHVISGYGFI